MIMMKGMHELLYSRAYLWNTCSGTLAVDEMEMENRLEEEYFIR